jgi:formylglycine-generating enzyme required for sulfatase activity
MAPTARTKVFVSYSRKDKRWLDDLHTHLAPLAGQFDLWDDSRQVSGQPWLPQIETALAECKAAVLLVSPDFLASRFIAESEVSPLLAAADATGVPLLCIYVRPSSVAQRVYTFERASGERRRVKLTDYQGLNDPRRPLSKLDLPKRDEEWVAIAERFERALKEIGAAAPATAAAGTHSAAAAPAKASAPAYLKWLYDQHRWLEVRGIGAMRTERVELLRVYTRLRVSAAMAEQDPARRKTRGKAALKDDALLEARPRDLTLRDLLREHEHLVLVGDPGAGKTTFLRFVALNLAGVQLGKDVKQSLDRLGLRAPAPFPILVRLADFERWLRTNASPAWPADCAEQFHLYLDFLSRGLPRGVPEIFLRERVLAGGSMLLLDGLDEVPGESARARVGAILGAVVAEGRERGNRHVVTCRTRAYEGRAQLGADFTRADLVDFGQAEIEEFVREWSRALFQVPRGKTTGTPAAHADRHERELLQAIRAHPHVRPLTANPLLLTILAVVHWNRKKLPEQRADLYEDAIQYLLETRTEQSRYEATIRRDCLTAIARALFEDRQGVRKTLGRAEAAALAAPLLSLPDAKSAVPFIEDEELHSGILVSRIEGEVEFWHPTFGEYLAAAGLAWEPDYWDRVRGHLFEERWNEVVLLLAGCRRKQGLRHASDFIGRIITMDASLAGRARAVGLVGRILRDISPAGGDPAAGTGYAEGRQQVLAIFERGSDVPEKVRVEVGEALGHAGDPRISDDDHGNRIFIKGGTFWMGAQSGDAAKPGYDQESYGDEKPVHRVTLSDFLMDRYPVTVGQFRRFVEAGAEGYLDQRFWSADGWRWRKNAKRSEPDAWADQSPHANRPVVRVSWYEAEAYCAWLSARSGRRVTLPTEAQWEYAARGEAGRKYPWSDAEPTDQHMNFGNRVGHPTPVGIYPLGATPEGVQDLSGNVLEWCQDWSDDYQNADQADPAGPSGGTSRVLRGGGIDYNARRCRAAYRNNGHPGSDYGSVGFRGVVVFREDIND